MAFVPNIADPIPIVLHHTPSDTATPALLYPGEAAVCHGPSHTKMWIGDGTTNRLFLSTNPADSPLLNQSVLGGPFLPLAGGTLAGPGNLAVNGTLAVSNSATVSATIANTGSGATALKVSNSGIGTGVGLDVEGENGGLAILARGQIQVFTGQDTNWWFTSSLLGSTINPAANCIRLEGDGGGLLVRLTDRVNDLAGIYALGIQRNSLRDTCPFIQMFDSAGLGSMTPSDPGRVIGSIWFGGYDATSVISPYHPQVLRSAAISVEPSETWSGTGHGSRILFDVTANGTTAAQTALTIDHDGSLKVSDATPTITWDKTGVDPLQWELRTAEGTNENFWGLHEDGDWRFYVYRSDGPPVAYGFYIDDPTTLASWLRVDGYISCNGNIIGDSRILSQGGEFLSYWSSDNPVSAPVFATMRMRDTGNIETGDVIGAVEFHSREQGGGTRRAAMIQAVATENHTVNIVGTELEFFTVANGGFGSVTPVMTLGQDANLTVVGSVTASGTLLTSDPALKEISPAPRGALAKVRELPVIDFRWKHGRDSKLHRGFSATDVTRVMGKDSGCSAEGAYSLADMNAVLWQAVQELSTEIQELRSRIDGPKRRRAH